MFLSLATCCSKHMKECNDVYKNRIHFSVVLTPGVIEFSYSSYFFFGRTWFLAELPEGVENIMSILSDREY
jgi:hypothetical protein